MKLLFNINKNNWETKLASLNTNAHEANQLFANIELEKLAKQIQNELTSMDKENASLYNFKSNLLKIEPSGDTPKKPNDYGKQLVHYRTPIAAKYDNSLLDVSVEPLNISAVLPEDIGDIEELLEEEVVESSV